MVKVEKVTRFPNTQEGSGVAAVKLSCGPVMMHAKLRKAPESGQLFLSWPARESKKDGKWFSHFYIVDPQVRREVEHLAVQAYERAEVSAFERAETGVLT